jgi:hypothetical protein
MEDKARITLDPPIQINEKLKKKYTLNRQRTAEPLVYGFRK